MFKNIYFAIILMAGLLVLPQVAVAEQLLAIDVKNDRETITLSLKDPSQHKVFLLTNPDRMVVDVPSLASKAIITLPKSYEGDLIRAVRAGQFDPYTTRFVFELKKKIAAPAVYEDQSRLNIVIDEAATGRAVEKKKSIGKKEDTSKNPIIVIDAGHGGVDPGTVGPKGTQEKDVVLAFAKALKAKLQKTGRYEAKLTRDADYFIMLRKRIDIARKNNATIFISLHADSAPDSAARGLSVYTVSEQASDKEAEALAARENKSDVIGGMDLSNERADVADILISLAQRETMNRSAELADHLVEALGERVPLLQNTHRFAGFAVLKAPDVPSVLIETGFLSHPKEEKLLNSMAYREKVIAGIVDGIDDYFDTQKTGTQR